VQTISDHCLLDKGISYASPAGAEDSSNKYDTPQTVAEIEAHNLVYQRICSKPQETH
jgi:hypothetical protein